MAEMTNKTQQLMGNYTSGSMKLVIANGQSAVNADTITVTLLTTIVGFYAMVASDGTTGTAFAAGNVITINNSAAKLWTCIVWGT